MKKFTGFTLAEVLITLTIIGVISVLTVPSLIGNINNQTNMAKLRKGYAAVNQAIGMQMAEDGGLANDAASISKDNTLMQQGIMSIIAKNISGSAIDADTWKSSDGIIYHTTAAPIEACHSKGENVQNKAKCGDLYIITKINGDTEAKVDAAIGRIITVDDDKNLQPGSAFVVPYYKDGIDWLVDADKTGNYESAFRVINNTLGQADAEGNNPNP